jgi:hypothetical protein
MPVFLRVQGYKIYFWSNENDEPIHFHVTKGDPSSNDTKIWVKEDKTFKIAHNKGKVPDRDLMRILILMHSYVDDYIDVWKEHIGTVKYIDQ